MSENYKAVFDMKNIPEEYAGNVKALFVLAYNVYCDVINPMLPTLNRLYKERYNDDMHYEDYMGKQYDCIVGLMNKNDTLNKTLEYYIERPDLNFAARVKQFPGSTISFHLELED